MVVNSVRFMRGPQYLEVLPVYLSVRCYSLGIMQRDGFWVHSLICVTLRFYTVDCIVRE